MSIEGLTIKLEDHRRDQGHDTIERQLARLSRDHRQFAGALLELTRLVRHQSRSLAEILAVLVPPTERLIMFVDGEQINPGEIVTMNQDATGTISFKPQNAKGQKTKIDGVPEWASDPVNVIELTPAADGLTCKYKALDITDADTTDQSCVITVTVDADLGSGIKKIIGSVAATVTTGETTTVALTLVEDAPEPPVVVLP